MAQQITREEEKVYFDLEIIIMTMTTGICSSLKLQCVVSRVVSMTQHL